MFKSERSHFYLNPLKQVVLSKFPGYFLYLKNSFLNSDLRG